MPEQYNVLIHDLPVEERPRERLERYSAGNIQLAELLAIILQTGYQGVSVLQLAQALLSKFGGLRNLAGASVQELREVHGIGPAKASQVHAAFELGKRLAVTPDIPRPIITSPLDAVNLLMEDMRYLREEHFRALFLDARNQVIVMREISVGSLNASIVHPRETFKAAVSALAAAIIVAHNHPSGDPTPSAEDMTLTTRLVKCGELIGIPVLDHLIIGDGRHLSMKEKGLM